MMRKYLKGDAQKVIVQKEQVDEAKVFAACFDEINAYTFADENNKIYAVFGWWQRNDICGECFALLGQDCGKKLLHIIRFFKREIPDVMQRYHLQYAFMTVKKNFIPAKRLAKLLGFSLAADLPLFFNGSDYQLFERKL